MMPAFLLILLSYVSGRYTSLKIVLCLELTYVACCALLFSSFFGVRTHQDMHTAKVVHSASSGDSSSTNPFFSKVQSSDNS
jgi:hypothetical protein